MGGSMAIDRGVEGQLNLVPDGRVCAAVKVQKVYRGYRTRRRLADSAVVAEELWWQAIDYARLNHSTISFFHFDKHESPASRWHRVSVNASKVGKGLSKDAKAQKLAFRHWIEAIDPRHRYGHNLQFYYEAWCKSDAGQPFFYWLDLGDGKKLDLKECPRSKLRQQCIKYLGPMEREAYEYIVVEGKIIHKPSGELLDTTEVLGVKWIFVVSTTHRLYVGVKKKGEFHHSSFLAGGATLASGRLSVEKGVLKSISRYSGHYRPTDDSFQTFLTFLSDNGVNMDQVEILNDPEDPETLGAARPSVDRSSPARDFEGQEPPDTEIPKEEEKNEPQASKGITKEELCIDYKRNLSGGLQSPRAEVPKNVILKRMNSKEATGSYQLGRQLSNKWSTGAGPRIGCVADYPHQVRHQAMDLVNSSPKYQCGSAINCSWAPGNFSSLRC